MYTGGLLAAALLCSALGFAQKPEYDFYAEFREFGPSLRAKNPSITPAEVREKYAAKLRNDGVAEAEIARRIRLLKTEPYQLEADRWNRFYSKSDANYNRAPNAFLIEVVQGMRPGAALDYAMGTGRNSIYLAELGWKVSGFDFSDTAVATAQKRAKELGLTLDAVAVPDSAYEFGHERFDLILFSWAMPLVPVEKVIDSLKPGGVVVMECAENYVGRNGMLKMFDALRILRYEIVNAKADFYDRHETDIIRMVAKKP